VLAARPQRGAACNGPEMIEMVENETRGVVFEQFYKTWAMRQQSSIVKQSLEIGNPKSASHIEHQKSEKAKTQIINRRQTSKSWKPQHQN
jgi:hypothetical protein